MKWPNENMIKSHKKHKFYSSNLSLRKRFMFFQSGALLSSAPLLVSRISSPEQKGL